MYEPMYELFKDPLVSSKRTFEIMETAVEGAIESYQDEYRGIRIDDGTIEDLEDQVYDFDIDFLKDCFGSDFWKYQEELSYIESALLLVSSYDDVGTVLYMNLYDSCPEFKKYLKYAKNADDYSPVKAKVNGMDVALLLQTPQHIMVFFRKQDYNKLKDIMSKYDGYCESLGMIKFINNLD